MKIQNAQQNYYVYLKTKQIEKQSVRPIEQISSIVPSGRIPDSAYIQSMQTLGTIIDIRI